MIRERDKYKAGYFQIGAFSCMAPLGKVILDIKEMNQASFTLAFFIHIVVALILFYFGIILLGKGLFILEE